MRLSARVLVAGGARGMASGIAVPGRGGISLGHDLGPA